MKYVDCGNGKIPFISLIAILSISLVVNLPGLGISPIEGKLDQVFPHVTDLEIQLLTILPNLMVIPFILLSGKLCTQKNQLLILGLGLVVFALSGVMYLFTDSMIQLILISCVLGVGCGFVIPLAASLIAQNFTGAARTKQLGMKSSLSNFTVIFATLFVGWIANYGWHLSFLVYLIPLIPLCLIPFMRTSYINSHRVGGVTPKIETDKDGDINVDTAKGPAVPVTPHSVKKKALYLLAGLIGFYISITYATEVVSYYLPFTMQHYQLTTGDVGVATAAFFLACTISGFFLTQVIRWLGRRTPYVALAMCIVGLYLCGFVHLYITYMFGVFIMGMGYGVLQPIIYDKTTFIAPTAADSTRYFSYLLTGNYIGISMVPFIVSLFARIFNSHSVNFSYILNGSILIIVLAIAFWKSRSFIFWVTSTSMDPSAQKSTPAPTETPKQ